MAKVLLTRPSFDLATKYLSVWSHKFIEENEARGWGHVFTDLYEDAASLTNFENNIGLNEIFLGLGHGNKKIFTGQDNEVLIHADVNADVMSGKPCYLASCLPPEEEVVSNPSIKPISSITIGDDVLTHQGRFKQVIDTFDRDYVGNLLMIVPRKLNIPFKVTSEHPILAIKAFRCKRGVRNKYGKLLCKPRRNKKCKNCVTKPFQDYQMKWVLADDLTKDYFLAYPIIAEIVDKPHILITDHWKPKKPKKKESKTDKILKEIGNRSLHHAEIKDICEKHGCCRGLAYHIQLRLKGKMGGFSSEGWQYKADQIVCKNYRLTINNQVNITEAFMELAGYYVSDGTVSLIRGGTVTIALNRKKEINKARKVRNLVKQCFNLKATIREYAGNMLLVRFYCKPVAILFKTLFGSNAKTKHLPQWVLTLPHNKQKALLKGLNAGDGYKNKRGFWSYSTCSKTLAFQFVQILLRIGIIPCLTHKPNYKSKIGIFTINQRTKSRSGYFWKNYLLLPIRKIQREHYEGKVFNLEVKDDNSFTTLSSTLHNCLTGVTLLPRMVEETCPEAYGYQADWVFVYHPDYYPDRVLEDPYASPFFDCMLTTGYAVLLRKTPLEVYEETIARYNYWWSYWLKQSDPFTDDILTWLNWNKRNFIAITPDGIHKMAAPIVPMQLALPMGAAALFLLATRGQKDEK